MTTENNTAGSPIDVTVDRIVMAEAHEGRARAVVTACVCEHDLLRSVRRLPLVSC